ncbi:NAD(P)/FAD-dependent oxidoreductase [Marinimicrococcus flavescens]|uniref:FAD-binding oxidoreductase n=1 Tax=Marinimicrococcus flavescens TaxID=3031815 RepID=A0AAP3XQ22_9PROT|nr:FAD-binding oxidoreductase [Marinimicrococcus flavescens]
MPLTADTPTWYHLACREPAPALPALTADLETRVAVVGGGLAGLATALSLAERGIACTLLEAGEPGGGASGRNGGMVSAGFTRGSLDLARKLGLERARALHDASRLGMALIRARVERHAIACDLVEGVAVASWFDEPAALREEVGRLNRDFAMRLSFLPREAFRELYRSPRYFDGILDPEGFHLDPLALSRGYARAAAGLGTRIFANSPVHGLERSADGKWRLVTPEGSVVAEEVVLCTSAYGDALLPALRRAILPVATFVMVTEPLGERLAGAIRAPFAVYDDRFATGYYRPLPGGRLLWGGRISLRERQPDLAGLLKRDLARVYPQLGGVEVAAAWPGRMGFARHKMPLVRRLQPGLWVNSCHGGHGLNGTSTGGELIARAIQGEAASLQPFAPFAPQPVFGPLGRIAAQAVYWGHAARDAWRSRSQVAP